MKIKLSLYLAMLSAFTVSAHDVDPSQFEGQPYEVVKSQLLANGWQTIPKQQDELSFSEAYPEITCGSGSMAICSVGFQKQQHSIAFVVQSIDEQIIVLEEY